MQKKLAHKRRLRQHIQKCVPLVALFFLTLCGLLTYAFFIHRKEIISPIGKAYSSVVYKLTNNTESQVKDIASRYHITIIHLDINATSATIKTENNLTIIVSTKKDLSQQFASLQLIQKELTIEGKSAKILDFRFDNPVVMF